jgi:chromosome partitioning protein
MQKAKHPFIKKTPKTIGVIQVKGGAGRSTLATNLAGELSKVGKTVLIDGDMPQGTSASWYAVRQQAGKAGNLVSDTAANHAELVTKAGQYKGFDYIVLDGPPRIAEMTRAILMLSDICLIPVGASVAEIWATADVLTIIEQAKKVRPIDARMIWTRHRSFTNLAKELTEQAKAELGLPTLKTAMALRVAYTEALGAGLTVAELPDVNARFEMRELVAEIRRLVR